MKYNKKIVKRICDLLSKDSYTIPEVCSLSDISETTYHEWKATKPEFAEAVARARDKFDEILVKEAKESLRKKVAGYEVEEVKTVYVNSLTGKPTIKEQTKVKKHFQPDTAAIQFVLTNKAPEEYKNRQNTELTGKGGKDLLPPARVLSKKEMKELLTELENEC
jgi:hypothetical protein